jgi:hypothetical protein
MAEVDYAEVLKEHVAYEVQMLVDTFARLALGGDKDICTNNALIESFCVHVRNLDHFFLGATRNGFRTDDVDAAVFTDEAYVRYAGSPTHSSHLKILKQILHLTLERGTEPKHKFNASDMHPLFVDLMGEIRRFERHLQPNYRLAWDGGVGPKTLQMACDCFKL